MPDNEVGSKAIELMQSLDSIAKKITNCILENHVEDMDRLLSHRQRLIMQLIALHPEAVSAATLHEYLGSLRQYDRWVMSQMSSIANDLKNQMMSVGKAKKYLTP